MSGYDCRNKCVFSFRLNTVKAFAAWRIDSSHTHRGSSRNAKIVLEVKGQTQNSPKSITIRVLDGLALAQGCALLALLFSTVVSDRVLGGLRAGAHHPRTARPGGGHGGKRAAIMV